MKLDSIKPKTPQSEEFNISKNVRLNISSRTSPVARDRNKNRMD
ncbi:hypothetical protein S7335_4497 [Synechococcus sp. PCC 7335]|nr:hypothetical protein S7335_4497 [Synechococcus sp. PCC 7335]